MVQQRGLPKVSERIRWIAVGRILVKCISNTVSGFKSQGGNVVQRCRSCYREINLMLRLEQTSAADLIWISTQTNSVIR